MWVNVWFNGVHSLVYSLSSARVMMEVKALREDNKCHRGMSMVAEMNEWDIVPKKSYPSLIQQAKKKQKKKKKTNKKTKPVQVHPDHYFKMLHVLAPCLSYHQSDKTDVALWFNFMLFPTTAYTPLRVIRGAGVYPTWTCHQFTAVPHRKTEWKDGTDGANLAPNFQTANHMCCRHTR